MSRAMLLSHFLRTQAIRSVVLLLGLYFAGAAQAFSLNDVSQRAKQLAEAPYKAPPDRLPKELKDIDREAYRDIRFKPDHAYWRADKLPFELTFFHVGRDYRDPVRINELTPKGAKPIPFDPDDFDYGRNKIDPKSMRDLGYAGFRAHYAMNRKDFKDEVVVFLGASYLRAVGKDQQYGLSARGLAVDVATSTGEEFPRFTEFWIERPSPRATSLTIYALMDSKRVTGAYRFEVVPGTETMTNVSSVLYTREAIGKLGLAPLTSMFFFGENQPGVDDYRPEVHDSDGLSVWTGDGEWIWRPLVNPARLLVTSYGMKSLKGFGLMQRDRDPTNYEDPDLLYERRPSAWVEPVGNWGAGRVELVQIPTPDETNDNIVAFWVPQALPAAGKPLDIAYKVHWQAAGTVPAGKGWVVQTRRGRGFARKADGDIQYVVDFDGPALRSLAAPTDVEPVIWVDANAEVRERNLFKNPVSGAWRMTVRFKRNDAAKPVELRAYLKQQQAILTETWSYILPAEADKP